MAVKGCISRGFWETEVWQKGYNFVEDALNEWFSTVTAWGLSVSGPMFKIEAEEFSKKVNHNLQG